MADLAALGIAVDSSNVKTASQDLTVMASSANMAEDATTDLAVSSQRLIQSLGNQVTKVQQASKSYGDNNALVRQMVDTNSQLNRVLDANSRAWQAANDNMEQSKKSIIGTANELITFIKLLKDVAFATIIGNQLVQAYLTRSIAPAWNAIKMGFEKSFPILSALISIFFRIISPILPLLGAISLAATALTTVLLVLGTAWGAASEKADEFRKISASATASDVSIPYFLRLKEAASQAGVGIEKVTEMMKNFRDSSEPTLGGSELLKLLDKLKEAGNFKGINTDIFKTAVGTQERFEAMSKIITEAMRNGERLAALKLADEFLPDDMMDKLRAFPNFLEAIVEKSREVKINSPFTEEEIKLQGEIDAKLKSIGERWEKIKEPLPSLVSLGLELKKVWVDILDDITKSLERVVNWFKSWGTAVDDLIAKLPNVKMPDWLANIQLPDWLRSVLKVAVTAPGSPITAVNAMIGMPSPLINKPMTQQEMFDNRFTGAFDTGENPFAFMKNPFKSLGPEMERYLRMVNEIAKDTSKVKDETAATATEFDRLVKSIARSTAAMEAEVLSVGKGVEEQARLRTAARLTEAAIQDFGTVSEETQKKIDKLADRVAQATKKLAEARLKSDISFGGQTMLLSETDVAIASRLRDLYGDDVPRALNSSFAAALRFQQTIRDTASIISTNLTSSLMDWVSGTKTAKEAFIDMARSVVRSLTEIIIKQYVVAALMRLISSAVGMFGGFSQGAGNLGMMNGDISPSLSEGVFISGPGMAFNNALGNAFGPRGVIPFGMGGVVGSPTMFGFGGGTGLMGEAGPEAIMPLRRNARGELGVSGGGMSITINNTVSKDHDVRLRQESNQGHEELIIDVVKKATARGDFDPSNSSRYGLRNRKVR